MENQEEKSKLEAMRHSAEHVLTQAMVNIFGEDKIIMAMGPSTDDGFYFDFDSPENFSISEEDFDKIEAEMKRIQKENQKFERREISIEDAKKLFKGNKYKLEWLEEIEESGEKATIYVNIDKDGKEVFADLCKGPHVSYTKQIGKFKLLSLAGAYWRGDEKNKMLTRLYGTTFKTQEELEEFIKMKEEAKKRDHRKLARELDLIIFSDLIGAGLPMYTPRGTVLRSQIYNYSRELNNEIGYKEVYTPNFNKAELFKISGHYEKYKNDMLRIVSRYSDEEMFFKPMNCPQHTQIYASQKRSYRDLPIRYSDFANLARDERPGEMHGILRTRIFAQDDGHAFVREDQIEQEFNNVLGVIIKALKTYGMKYWIRLSLRDNKNKEKYLGDDTVWEKAEGALRKLLQNSKVDYKEAEGEAAIYGPKMDFMAVDNIGREWQLSTIQIDMNMPSRFGIKYTDKDGIEKTPIMIHRAIVGSERFVGIIIEHFAGAFPAWISPEQVALIPIGTDNHPYADKLEKVFKEAGIRVINDKRDENMQGKIRDAQKMKIPYMLIFGKREEEQGNVSIRFRDRKENIVMKVDEFKDKLLENIQEKKLELDL